MSLTSIYLTYKAEAWIFGIVFGLVNGLSPGPTLTMVITQTLQYNLKEGIKIALAPLIFGIAIIPLSLLFFLKLVPVNSILIIISLIGAVYLFYLGYQLIQSPNTNLYLKDEAASFKKGILVNFVSPYAYLFWFTVGTPLLIQFFSINIVSALIFICCYYLLLIGSKVLIAYTIEKSKLLISNSFFSYILKFFGFIYIFFAVLFLKQALSIN